MRAVCKRFVTESSGQDLIEYALLAATISVAAITAIGTLGLSIDTYYETIRAGLFK